MRRALEIFVIEGVQTTIPLHRQILADPDFIAGRFDTGFLDRLVKTPAPSSRRWRLPFPRSTSLWTPF